MDELHNVLQYIFLLEGCVMYVTTSVIKGMDLAQHDILWDPSCVVFIGN